MLIRTTMFVHRLVARAVAVAGAVLIGGCADAAAGSPYLTQIPVAANLRSGPVSTVADSRLPLQGELKAREVYLSWHLASDAAGSGAGNTVRLSWNNTTDLPPYGCGSVPAAVRLIETSAAVDIGLIGTPPSRGACAAIGLAATFSVTLHRPLAARHLYRLAQ